MTNRNKENTNDWQREGEAIFSDLRSTFRRGSALVDMIVNETIRKMSEEVNSASSSMREAFMMDSPDVSLACLKDMEYQLDIAGISRTGEHGQILNLGERLRIALKLIKKTPN